ncbi:DUF4926 domain-containing protein [Methylobacterium sp. A49B]|jgi:hypothetical protein|uniref:DUF4926 domain-containing protein n=1 Tax=Methylobacterium mesophilicum SR1.6/6 TaxID=908290 RepID=A0A6B9FN38_9HYPH|nr:DUF4926 domain-containing protein [Methylobacterium mesophilicum]QGY03983.1 DUF4926 domain-containing protein [Methylobacterium mesophilicum SR1.6/6]
MSVDAHYIVRRNELRSDLRDLDRVALTAAAVTDDGVTMEVGSEGTIVGVWRDGEAYEVEFAEPAGALATVEAMDLRLVKRANA